MGSSTRGLMHREGTVGASPRESARKSSRSRRAEPIADFGIHSKPDGSARNSAKECRAARRGIRVVTRTFVRPESIFGSGRFSLRGSYVYS